MTDAPQTGTFTASKTNSAPTSPPIPYHIEQGLRGEVGTTQLPYGLSRTSSFLTGFLAILSFVGVLWALQSNPVLAVILAVCAAGIVIALRGIFHAIPYLEQRRSGWTSSAWRLLRVCFVLLWATFTAVSFLWIFHGPASFRFPAEMFQAWQPRSVEQIEADLRKAADHCVYYNYDCDKRVRLVYDLRDAKSADRTERVQATDNTGPDFTTKVLMFIAAVAAFGAILGIATYGAGFSSEAGAAIWREPHNGGYGAPTATPAKTNDLLDPTKKKAFDIWYDKRIIKSQGASLSVEAAFLDYNARVGDDQASAPPIYDLARFKSAMKGKVGESVMVKEVPSYQDVTLAGSAATTAATMI
jgi:hypothetical protein